ncbi:tryptophan 7-halogenase [Sphingomonas sp. AR_OL41]|uniref:tryptophan halogenase family protein n=1 Tax=Sphingomonas sp. AR_OL41 TaxID=3042729 RepID=UPI00247FCB6F|nr:tryptophan halogenase family protein [Sphingomonas sp. AR_OL41]MDH7973487.1 tryptophan 7-halogenase [Sphingomonas sp. AR_OL41]
MSAPGRIVILGGGTAGWMAANLFAQRWPGTAQVTVIESPEIGIIGVGEGSTPQLKAFFDTLGITEAEWMPACNATYKNGISFHGWSDRPGHESYFHPFPSPLDLHSAPAFFFNGQARRFGNDVWAHPDRFFLPPRLAAQRLAPIAAESFPLEPSYGYHFDAHLVGAFLRDHAMARGVTHLQRRIVEVAVDNGQVTQLVAEDGEAIGADLFVDSSGFRSVIHQAALGVPFRSFADNLFNDRAVVMPTPADPSGTASATRSTALKHGWAWDIPLTSRTGNGYVYGSRYTTPEEAEAELRAHLGLGEEVAARHLSMKVGRVEATWSGNSLAIGLAQGFIEPLEATALHIVQATVEGFIAAWEAGGFTPANRDAFNQRIAARYDGIRDYIVCHYRMNRRSDTAYWRDNAANDRLSDSLKAIITCWFTGQDLEREIADQGIAGYYPATSWQCLLAGYGQFPDDARLHAPEPAALRHDMAAIDELLRRAALNFRDHKAVLAELN